MPNETTRTRKKTASKAPKPASRGTRALTLKEMMFVHELLKDERMVAWKAYRRAFQVTNQRTCEVNASRLLSLAKVKKYLQEQMEARMQRVKVSQDQVFNRLWGMFTADVNEIMEYRRENCRHCHGKDFAFQWRDETEFRTACADVERNNHCLAEGEKPQQMPTNEGGYGFVKTDPPNPDCPNCSGEGYGHTHFHDTRFLSGDAARLFAGVKETQNGTEVKVHDQLAIGKLIMQHMGMLDPKLTIKGDKENPLIALLQSLPGNTLKPVEDD